MTNFTIFLFVVITVLTVRKLLLENLSNGYSFKESSVTKAINIIKRRSKEKSS